MGIVYMLVCTHPSLYEGHNYTRPQFVVYTNDFQSLPEQPVILHSSSHNSIYVYVYMHVLSSGDILPYSLTYL